MRTLLYLLIKGVYDSLRFHRVMYWMSTNETIKARIYSAWLLNGVVMGASIMIYNYGIAPNVPSNILLVTDVCFQLFWLLPMYLISSLINTMSLQELAEQMYPNCVHVQGTVGLSALQKWNRIKRAMSEEVNRLCIFAVLAIQAQLLGYVNSWLFTMHYAWIYGSYCFDYLWCYQQLCLEHKFHKLQSQWPYFLGYGLVMTICLRQCANVPYLSYVCFHTLFPCFLILGLDVTEPTKELRYLPILAPSRFVINHFFKLLACCCCQSVKY